MTIDAPESEAMQQGMEAVKTAMSRLDAYRLTREPLYLRSLIYNLQTAADLFELHDVTLIVEAEEARRGAA